MSTVTAKAQPIYTPPKNSPSRVSSPAIIRKQLPQIKSAATDLESLSKRLNSVVQDLGTIAPNITVTVTLTVDDTGTGTASLGTANCPATELAHPTTWVQVTLPDGTIGWTPVWV